MKPILRKVDIEYNCSFSIKEHIFPYLYNHWHYHPEIEFTLIRKGNGMRLVGDNMEVFEDGDLILLGSNLPHMWRSDAKYFSGQEDLLIEAIAIHFEKDFWGQALLELPELKSIKDILELSKRGIKITGKSRDLITEKMEEILVARDAKRIELLLHMLDLIAYSDEYKVLASNGFTKIYHQENTERINKIYQYTFNNFQNCISVKEVAAVANLSPHSFCRYFKTRTLKTYWEFLLDLRIGYACKLLIENKMSIAQVCYDSGFNNLSNFNRHFKNYFQLTPLQYIKTYVTNPGKK